MYMKLTEMILDFTTRHENMKKNRFVLNELQTDVFVRWPPEAFNSEALIRGNGGMGAEIAVCTEELHAAVMSALL